jgi:hypothetical protein
MQQHCAESPGLACLIGVHVGRSCHMLGIKVNIATPQSFTIVVMNYFAPDMVNF